MTNIKYLSLVLALICSAATASELNLEHIKSKADQVCGKTIYRGSSAKTSVSIKTRIKYTNQTGEEISDSDEAIFSDSKLAAIDQDNLAEHNAEVRACRKRILEKALKEAS